MLISLIKEPQCAGLSNLGCLQDGQIPQGQQNIPGDADQRNSHSNMLLAAGDNPYRSSTYPTGRNTKQTVTLRNAKRLREELKLGKFKPTTGSHYKSSTHARPTITVRMQNRSTSVQENPRKKSVQVQVYSRNKSCPHSATRALSAAQYGDTYNACVMNYLICPASLRSAKRLHI